VRSLAAELGVPAAITGRTATTDTFSAAQTQREFFFGVDEAPFDHVLFGFETGQSAAAVAQIARVAVDVVEGVYADLTRRQPFLRYLLSQPIPDEL
jgi:NH3-dependent NAD+ synthetase